VCSSRGDLRQPIARFNSFRSVIAPLIFSTNTRSAAGREGLGRIDLHAGDGAGLDALLTRLVR